MHANSTGKTFLSNCDRKLFSDLRRELLNIDSKMQDFEVLLQLIRLELERLNDQCHEQLETMVERHKQEIANIRAQHSEKLRRLRMQARAIHEHDVAMSLRRSEEMNTAYATEFQHELLKIVAAVAASSSAQE